MKLGPLPAEKIIKVLVRFGFLPIRQKGSHVILQHADGRLTIVPYHPRAEVGRGLLRRIIKEAELDREEFLKMLEE